MNKPYSTTANQKKFLKLENDVEKGKVRQFALFFQHRTTSKCAFEAQEVNLINIFLQHVQILGHLMTSFSITRMKWQI